MDVIFFFFARPSLTTQWVQLSWAGKIYNQVTNQLIESTNWSIFRTVKILFKIHTNKAHLPIMDRCPENGFKKAGRQLSARFIETIQSFNSIRVFPKVKKILLCIADKCFSRFLLKFSQINMVQFSPTLWSKMRALQNYIAGSVQYCRSYQLFIFWKNWVLKFGRGCEIMELRRNLNFITRILKQNVRLHYICRGDFILDIKGKQKKSFSRFLEIRQ